MAAQPKPGASAPVYTVEPSTESRVPQAAQPIKAFNAFWHEVGSNLPWYINHSRKTRRAMQRWVGQHGR